MDLRGRFICNNGGVKRVSRPYLRARRGSVTRPSPWVAGVCSGAAYHLSIPVWAVRTITGLAALLGGSGVLLYVWLWVTIPKEGTAKAVKDLSERAPDGIPLKKPLAETKEATPPVSMQLVLAGISALGLAAVLAFGPALSGIPWTTILWWLLVIGGLILVWSQAPRLSGLELNQALGFIVLGVLLMALGSVRLLVDYDLVPVLSLGFIIGLIILLGLLLALAPIGIKLLRDLTVAKTSEAREAERADIAAHLHDSVLQTLTLIRAGADDSTRVRSLALTQERELRAWLYTGHTEAEDSVAQALQVQASAVESIYGVAVEVVAVGDTIPGPAELAAVAAAGEAMTNAAKHGAPPISVFQEVAGTGMQIYVKDSGDGFDPTQIPDDRHGYRHSIVGRVERVGGKVSVRNRGGTEVSIWVPRQKEGSVR